MIYTVTFNPSLDYIVSVEDFRLGHTNRTSAELMLPGGKGINVSTVLMNLGITSRALGFTAGFVGDEIERRLERMGVQTDFIRISEGVSRINVKLKSIEGTEINGAGPAICQGKVKELMGRLNDLGSGDALVLAGSIPASMPKDIYRMILEQLKGREVTTVVDAAGDLLLEVLPLSPFLIKPNIHELGELFDTEIRSKEEAAIYGKKLQERGARNVLISMAGAGAILVEETGRIHEAKAPEGILKNGVGAGDSMVAGFLVGWMERHDYSHAFYMGVAAGSASAFSELLATRQEIENVYRQVTAAGENTEIIIKLEGET